MTNEQMDTLIGRLKVYGSESGRGKDHPNAIACRTAASVIIEQHAEIERLRDHLLKMLNQLHGRAVKHPGQMQERTAAYIALGEDQ